MSDPEGSSQQEEAAPAEWQECVIKDVSGALLVQGDHLVEDSVCSESTYQASARAAQRIEKDKPPLPACVSINSKGELPSFDSQYKREADKDELKEHVRTLADKEEKKREEQRGEEGKGDGGGGGSSAARRPPAAATEERLPLASETSLKKETFTECYSALMKTIAAYQK